MSETLDRSAEILKLARLLDAEPKELDFLEQLPSAALYTLRDQVAERLFAADADRLKRVAAASLLAPVPVVVRAARHAFGPLLCGATASQLDPAHAVRIAARLPVDFLADIAVSLDPRRAPGVISAVPKDIVVAVTQELVRRGEHISMGRFVNFLPRETLAGAIPAVGVDADLLKVAFTMEGKDSLDDVLELARDRIDGLIRAAHEHDLWAEALDLITHLNAANLRELADRAVEQDDEVLESLVRAVARDEMWDALLPLTSAMSERALTRFAAVPAVGDPAVLAAIIETAARDDLWNLVLPLADALPEAVKPRLAGCLGALDRDQMLAGLRAAIGSDNLATLVDISLRQDAAGRRRVLDLVAATDGQEEFAALLTDETPDLVWDALVESRVELPESVRALVRDRAAASGRDAVVASLT